MFPCDSVLLLNKLWLSAQELEDKIRKAMESIHNSLPEAGAGGRGTGEVGEGERGEGGGSLLQTRKRSAGFDEAHNPGQAPITNDFTLIRADLQVPPDLSTASPAIALHSLCMCPSVGQALTFCTGIGRCTPFSYGWPGEHASGASPGCSRRRSNGRRRTKTRQRHT